jgi:MinD superfamily P-loop ATPase
MKEITILSGKGGAGKTIITSALATVAHNAVFCDNDVDAADLHLIFKPEVKKSHTFTSGWKVRIDPLKCMGCGLCMSYCRFNAISPNKKGVLFVNPFQCEGCRLCERMCPEQAITSERSDENYWYISKSRFGWLVHAKLMPGGENSGKLVTQVRNGAKAIAEETNADYIICDGPPGVGCAAISSLSGTQQVLVVIEPSKSGLHDAQRLQSLISSFKIPSVAVINKYNINSDITKVIEDYLISEGIPLLMKIPFDKEVVHAMTEGKSIVEYNPGSEITEKIHLLWKLIN